MKRAVPAVLLMLALTLAAAPVLLCADGAGADAEAEAAGAVVAGFVKVGNLPFDDADATVTVTAVTLAGDVVASSSEGGIVGGEFRVPGVPTALGTDYYLSIKADGYTVCSASAKKGVDMAEHPTPYGYQFRLPGPDEDGVRRITGGLDGSHCIGLTKAFGGISGRVSEGSYALTGAKISVIDKDGNVVDSALSNRGRYAMANIPVGSYTVTCTMDGYDTMSGKLNVEDGKSLENIDFSMSPQETYGVFGLDIPHFLMMIIGIGGIVLVVASMALLMRIRSRKSDLVYDDEEKPGQGEEERGPRCGRRLASDLRTSS